MSYHEGDAEEDALAGAADGDDDDGGALCAGEPCEAQKLLYQDCSSARSDAAGHSCRQTLCEDVCSEAIRADWQKHDTYVAWLETGAAGGTQPSWALMRTEQERAQAGNELDADWGSS